MRPALYAIIGGLAGFTVAWGFALIFNPSERYEAVLSWMFVSALAGTAAGFILGRSSRTG